MWDTLKGDPFIRITLFFYALVCLTILLPAFPEDQLALILDYCVDPATIFLVILAFQHRLGRIKDAAEKRFWNLLTIAYGFWLVVELLYFLWDEAARTGH